MRRVREQPPRLRPAPPSLADALRGNIKEPQLADVAAHFFKQAGGAEEVAKILYQEFADARPGSVIRQRILDLVLKVTRYVNDRSGKTDDLSTVTDDDLMREAVALMAGLTDEEGEKTEAPAAAGGDTVGPDGAALWDCSSGL